MYTFFNARGSCPKKKPTSLPKGRVLSLSPYCSIFGQKQGHFSSKIRFFVRMSLQNILYEHVFLIAKDWFSIYCK
jgi:hypothetical protein